MRIFNRLVLIAAAFWLTSLCCAVLARESKNENASRDTSYASTSETREAYSARISQTYNFRFGKDHPSTPGNAQVEGGEFIQPGAFPTAAYCGRCHQEAYAEWRQALHSNSFRTPFYRTSVNILIRTKGIEFSRHCDSCHNPIAVLSGALTQDSQVDRSFDRDGLTCMTCHSIQKLQSTNGNGGFVMGVPAVMVDEKGNRIPGMVPDSEILAHLDRHSRAVMQDIYHQPEFCAACHKANLPESLNDYKFVRAFTTYDEWQQSKFSHRNPLTFYTGDFKTCQDCHMTRGDHALPEPGAKKGTFASHRWLAGNTAVPFYYGFDPQLEETIKFLQSGDYLNVDIFALKKAKESSLIAPLGSVPFRLQPNDIVETYVVIQNKNIGHSLIPEVRDLYEAWAEFIVKDQSGKEVYHSGFLKPDGSLDPEAHSFTNRPVTAQSDFVDNHKVWTIRTAAFDNTVQAGRSTVIRYMFRIPASVKGPLTITARVNYRHLRQSYLDNIFGKDHPLYPVVEITSQTRMLAVGENHPQAAASGSNAANPDWMRWNNFGIALLDQLQYAQAVRAFDEVAKLRPDYADAYTNIALTDIQWEKYYSASHSIQKALQLSPENARALYYSALIERRMGKPDDAIADLHKVVSQFPESRDARRELGISFYQKQDYPAAMEQFEALQQIDPDDLAAHYNLAILFRRMGRKQDSAEQQAMFATKKFDPASPTYGLNFIRKHPEISEESIPWHIHTNLPHTETIPSASDAASYGSGGQYGGGSQYGGGHP